MQVTGNHVLHQDHGQHHLTGWAEETGFSPPGGWEGLAVSLSKCELLLVAMPSVTSSFLFLVVGMLLVVRPGALSSVRAPRACHRSRQVAPQ